MHGQRGSCPLLRILFRRRLQMPNRMVSACVEGGRAISVSSTKGSPVCEDVGKPPELRVFCLLRPRLPVDGVEIDPPALPAVRELPHCLLGYQTTYSACLILTRAPMSVSTKVSGCSGRGAKPAADAHLKLPGQGARKDLSRRDARAKTRGRGRRPWSSRCAGRTAAAGRGTGVSGQRARRGKGRRRTRTGFLDRPSWSVLCTSFAERTAWPLKVGETCRKS